MGSLIPVCSIPLIPSWDLLALQIMQKPMEEVFPSAELPLTNHFDYRQRLLYILSYTSEDWFTASCSSKKLFSWMIVATNIKLWFLKWYQLLPGLGAWPHRGSGGMGWCRSRRRLHTSGAANASCASFYLCNSLGFEGRLCFSSATYSQGICK